MPLSTEEWRALQEEFDAELDTFMEEWTASLRAQMEADGGTVPEVKAWDESKHPRGGNPKNPGQFSSGQGGGAKPEGEATKPAPKPDRYPSFPGAPGARTPDQATRSPEQVPGDYQESPTEAKPSSSAERSPLHRSLEQSPVKSAKRLAHGINDKSLLTLADGTQAVFKPQRGEEKDARKGIPNGTLYKREVAASRLADALGFGDLVPATTIRDQGGDIGSAQAFVPDAEAPLASLQPFDGPEDAARAAVFDYILGHLDRHQNNWLLKNDKLVLIDNGCSLPVAHEQQDFFNMKMWEHVNDHDLPMPDVKDMAGKWPEAEKALRESGIEEEAIALAKQRFDAVTSGQYQRVKDLPSLIPEDQREAGDTSKTLGEMAAFYNRDARLERFRKARNEGRRREEEAEARENGWDSQYMPPTDVR